MQGTPKPVLIERVSMIVAASVCLFLGTAPAAPNAQWLHELIPPEVRSAGIAGILVWLAQRYGPLLWRVAGRRGEPMPPEAEMRLLSDLRTELRKIEARLDDRLDAIRRRIDDVDERIDRTKETP